MELTIKQCREILGIASKDTMYDYLSVVNLSGRTLLSWAELRKLLELQTFLGLRHGCHSKEQFKRTSREDLNKLFQKYGVDINARLQALKQNKQEIQVCLVLGK